MGQSAVMNRVIKCMDMDAHIPTTNGKSLRFGGINKQHKKKVFDIIKTCFESGDEEAKRRLIESMIPLSKNPKRPASDMDTTANGSADGHRMALAVALLNDGQFREEHRRITQPPSSHERQHILDNNPKGQEKRKWDVLLKWVEERRKDHEYDDNILDDPMFSPYIPLMATLKDGPALKKSINQALNNFNTIKSNYTKSGKGTSGEESYAEVFKEQQEEGEEDGEEEAEDHFQDRSSSSSPSPSSRSPSRSPSPLTPSQPASPSPDGGAYTSDMIK